MGFQSRRCPTTSRITRVTALMHTARKRGFPLQEHSLVLVVTKMRLENCKAPSKLLKLINHDKILWMLTEASIIQLDFSSRRFLHGNSSLCPPAIHPSWSIYSSSLIPLLFQGTLTAPSRKSMDNFWVFPIFHRGGIKMWAVEVSCPRSL